MEGIYVSENGVWFDSKQHPTPWIPVLSKRRRRIVLGAQWQKRLENSKEKWRALQTGKKRKRLQAETWVSIKPDEVKQTPKDVLTQLHGRRKWRSSQDDRRDAANLYWKMKEKPTHRGNLPLNASWGLHSSSPQERYSPPAPQGDQSQVHRGRCEAHLSHMPAR